MPCAIGRWALALVFCCPVIAAGAGLEIHFIDVEGGSATLIKTPAGESILADAGWPAEPDRGFTRLLATLRRAGVTRIDYFIATHFHAGHVGGLESLASQVDIRRFLDHGPSVEVDNAAARALWDGYVRLAGNRRTVVQPGDDIPLQGVQLRIVSAAGRHLSAPLHPGQELNPLCEGAQAGPQDPSENAQSVGYLLTLGDFRFLSLGDMTRDREHLLACPTNLIGDVDLLQASHHGRPESGPPELVRALAPQAAVVNNGARSIAQPLALKTLNDTPGLRVWQLHAVSLPGGADAAPKNRIANLVSGGPLHGAGILVSADASGSFTIQNLRNGRIERYPIKDPKGGNRSR